MAPKYARTRASGVGTPMAARKSGPPAPPRWEEVIALAGRPPASISSGVVAWPKPLTGEPLMRGRWKGRRQWARSTSGWPRVASSQSRMAATAGLLPEKMTLSRRKSPCTRHTGPAGLGIAPGRASIRYCRSAGTLAIDGCPLPAAARSATAWICLVHTRTWRLTKCSASRPMVCRQAADASMAWTLPSVRTSEVRMAPRC
mmetsp:Transcript_350/g.1216  ORF Transcript_350/g.1216 Transcript_350/m.1216 type:complete len:201 (-) Transcript_350:475-1077(-)